MSYGRPRVLVGEHCLLCGAREGFRAHKGYGVREAMCPACGASKRNSDLTKVLLRVLLNRDDLSLGQALPQLWNYSIYEPQAAGPIHDILMSLPGYVCSEFLEEVPVGSRDGSGVRSENLESLTFPDSCFDVVITQDIMEHVKNPERAFGEILRVLKPGGWHVFTVPFHEERRTVRRIQDDGMSVSLTLPAVYHDDPLKREGALVCTDFGEDLVDYLDSIGFVAEIGLHERHYRPEEIPYIASEESYKEYLNHKQKSSSLSYFKYNSVVFKSRKNIIGNPTSLEFTGERYVPNAPNVEIGHEHWHRYLYATQFVKDMDVLDIACGEGYGANLLAEHAANVIGVDIDRESVSHAKTKYTHDNLQFMTGSVAGIPINAANRFDVVVSFETIEHLDEETQHLFMKEVKRVLRPLGLFVVSTPNRSTYSDLPGYTNEFHRKEFCEAEFETFLKSYFRRVATVGQNIRTLSYIGPNDRATGRTVEYGLTYGCDGFAPASLKKDVKYIIAICTDGELDDLSFSLLLDESKTLVHEQLRSALTELSKRDDILRSIYASHGWRILEKLYRVRDRVLPAKFRRKG